MLFCNVDHIEPALLNQTRLGSSQFFEANQHVNEVFRQMELGSDREHGTDRQRKASIAAATAADKAAKTFALSARNLERLAQEIESKYPYINQEIKNSNAFADAARSVGISPDSPLVRKMVEVLLRDGIEGILRNCATMLVDSSRRVGRIGERVLHQQSFSDLDYDEAHGLMNRLSTLARRGQFVSAVAYLSARISA